MSQDLPLSSRRAVFNRDRSLMRSAGGEPTGSIFPTAWSTNKRYRSCGKGSSKNNPDGVAHEKQETAAVWQKKVRRSSGELLGATDEDGLVLPELLAEQGGPHWPRASATTQVLTFGASWDNRSDVNFLNPSVGSPDTTSNNSNSNALPMNKNKRRRRHSDPPPSVGGDRRGTGSTQGNKRRCGGSMGSAGGCPGGDVGGSRKSSSGSSGGCGRASDSSALCAGAEALSYMGQGQNQCPGGRRERHAEESRADLGAAGRTVAAGDAAAVQAKGSLFFPPALNVQNMGLSGSPAPSVESEFWDGDDVNDHGAGIDQVDPREAVQAALDRLMSSKRLPTKPRGLEGDAQLLESLLFSKSSSSTLEEDDPAIGVAPRLGGTGGKTSRAPRQSRASALLATPNTPANTTTTNNNKNNNKYANNNNRPRQRQGKPSGSLLSAIPSETLQNFQQLADGGSNQTSPASSLGSMSTPQSGDKDSTSPSGGASTALNPTLWKLVERGDTCPFDDCAFTVEALEGTGDVAGGEGGVAEEAGSRMGVGQTAGGGGRKAHKSRCRHFHTLCGCRHTRGALKGLLFQTNQLDKARNHQRKHTAGGDSGKVIPSSQEPLSQASQDTDMSNNEHSYGGGHDPLLSQWSEDEANAELDLLLSDGGGLEAEGKGSAEGGGRKGLRGSGGGSGARDGRRTWTDAESDRLREVMEHRGAGDSRKNWGWVAAKVGEAGGGRKTPSQCKMRWERILNPGVKKGLWTKHEDQKLKEVAAAMDYKWSTVAKMMGGRTYKQCRERYTNYLRDGLNCGPWSKEEDTLLLEMHDKIGNKWAEIARHFKDRSENMIKNEYMKLSRDAGHRRRHATLLGHGHESGDDSGADGGYDKACKKKGKRTVRLSNVSTSSSRASEAESPLPTPPRVENFGSGFTQARGLLEEGTGGISPEGQSRRRGVMTEGIPAQRGKGLSSASGYLHLMPKAEEMSI